MAVVGILAVHLASAGGQQVLQGPKAVLNPVAPLPCSDEPRPADGRVETHHVELILPGCTDHDECLGTICRPGSLQPRIAHAGDLRATTPGPIAELLQVTPLHLAPIGHYEGVGTLPFHKERALVGRGHMAHELRITKPTIGYDHRRGQHYAASAECCHASIEVG